MVAFREIGVFFALVLSFLLIVNEGHPEKPGTGENRRKRLQQARTWMYQIQEIESAHAIKALANTDYPLLVVEPNNNHKANPFDCRRMVKTLRTMVQSALFLHILTSVKRRTGGHTGRRIGWHRPFGNRETQISWFHKIRMDGVAAILWHTGINDGKIFCPLFP